jgi:hypothetical protein
MNEFDPEVCPVGGEITYSKRHSIVVFIVRKLKRILVKVMVGFLICKGPYFHLGD